MNIETKHMPGHLRLTRKNYAGLTVIECLDCKPLFHKDPATLQVLCNDHVIDRCPWCRPDSEPWKHGRGA